MHEYRSCTLPKRSMHLKNEVNELQHYVVVVVVVIIAWRFKICVQILHGTWILVLYYLRANLPQTECYHNNKYSLWSSLFLSTVTTTTPTTKNGWKSLMAHIIMDGVTRVCKHTHNVCRFKVYCTPLQS